MLKIKTGITGLDKSLHGGLPKGNIVLVSGSTGTGKTTFGLEFLVKGALEFKEKGLFISTEQSLQDLIKQGKQFNWPIRKLKKQKKLDFLIISLKDKKNALKLIEKKLKEFKPSRVVIDSLTTLSDIMFLTTQKEASQMTLTEIYEKIEPVPTTEEILQKKLLYNIFMLLKNYNVTALLTSELKKQEEEFYSSDGISEFIADGVIVLYSLGIGGAISSVVKIAKMRYTSHFKGFMPYDLTNKGIIIKAEKEASAIMK